MISQLTDELLLLRLRGGDRLAFQEVYDRYWPILYRHAFKLLKNDSECQDVIQDVFIKLWKIAPDLPVHTRLEPYLYTSTRNHILNIFSHSSVQTAYIESLGDFIESGYEVTDHLVREKILSKLIEEEIQKLPARMREVFELKRKENLSYKEISEQMNISELTVKTQMNKAITILRSKFGENLTIFLPFL
ncbi:RNA polymerase sigma-70 factor [Pedobacter sp. ISL-68]|uniref:RNA polymerase sigma factor n=1 Tax=unclassified Pedobacter TaxID=2628915 RepID=UPI001BE674A5|nr:MULTISPECIES: RNA polymerase sigma-70 factor [unclassified Pedobacter]MBT2560201.1 RNA polymerase sigma-70 factor [Pedobacter sp. ISL-64]MBT2589180.1 RNA polymerase sigma-70 factor [Pedobacter sp. ISL-68]